MFHKNKSDNMVYDEKRTREELRERARAAIAAVWGTDGYHKAIWDRYNAMDAAENVAYMAAEVESLEKLAYLAGRVKSEYVIRDAGGDADTNGAVREFLREAIELFHQVDVERDPAAAKAWQELLLELGT